MVKEKSIASRMLDLGGLLQKTLIRKKKNHLVLHLFFSTVIDIKTATAVSADEFSQQITDK